MKNYFKTLGMIALLTIAIMGCTNPNGTITIPHRLVTR